MTKNYTNDDAYFICMQVMRGTSIETTAQIVEWFKLSKNGQFRFIKDHDITGNVATLKQIDSIYPGVSVVTVSINPWARAWAGYTGLKVSPNLSDDSLINLNFETFESFLDGLGKIPHIDKYFQTEWTEYPVDNSIRSADYIFKEESIVEDFRVIQDYFQTTQPLNVQVPILEYQEFYNDTTQALVADIFKKDIEQLRYIF